MDIHEKLIEAAKQKNAKRIKTLIEQYSATDYDLEYDDKQTNALDIAVHNNHVEGVKLLMSFYDPCALNCHALHQAASKGHEQVLKVLLRGSDPWDYSVALIESISDEYNPCVQILLDHHADPTHQNSYALQLASAHQNQHAFDLLYEVSDPREALKNMDGRYTLKETQMLRERLQAEDEHDTISDAVPTALTSKNMKKI